MSRCMRPGPITSNGYLNFLREFRKKCCGMSAVETVRQGAKQWNRLSCKQKAKYRAMGRKGGCRKARRKRKRRGCRPKRRRRSSCRPKRRKRRGCRPKKKRRRSGCRKKRRPKRRCGRKRRPRRRRGGCGKRRKRCMKPGPVTANAYLNFLRAYRRKHCGLTPQETVKKGARRWCSLSPECKRRYMRQACKMTKSRRKKRSAICRSMRKKRRC